MFGRQKKKKRHLFTFFASQPYVSYYSLFQGYVYHHPPFAGWLAGWNNTQTIASFLPF